MRVVIFLTIFLSVFAFLSIYVKKRFIDKLNIKDIYKKYFLYFLIINYIGIIGYAIARYYKDFPNFLYFAFSLPIGILFLLFCTAFIYDLLNYLTKFMPISEDRRKILKKGFDISSLFLASSLTARSIYEVNDLVIENVNIKLKNLKQKYKLIQLSDIHIGGLIGKEYISNLVNKTNALNPDIIVITGDLIDTKIGYVKEAINELKNLKSKYGTYFIVGNHEYFHDIDEIVEKIKSLGITVLENQNCYIGNKEYGFNLVGIYDLFGNKANHHIPDLKSAIQGINTNSPTVLLSHQPKFILENNVENIDLVLSGHTHGGQIYPFRILVSLQQKYVAGLYQHSKNTQIYINRGTGFWGPPMRLGSKPEITLINLS
jgi:predicted MPP superfamily phosphohydrolase